MIRCIRMECFMHEFVFLCYHSLILCHSKSIYLFLVQSILVASPLLHFISVFFFSLNFLSFFRFLPSLTLMKLPSILLSHHQPRSLSFSLAFSLFLSRVTTLSLSLNSSRDLSHPFLFSFNISFSLGRLLYLSTSLYLS